MLPPTPTENRSPPSLPLHQTKNRAPSNMAKPNTATGEDDDDAPSLLLVSPHVAPHPLHLSLRRSFSLLRDRLEPPYSPHSLPARDLPDLASALALSLLSSPSSSPPFPRTLLALLHSTSPLSYRLLSSALSRVSLHLYPLLLPLPRANLPLLLPPLLRVRSPSLDPFLLALLRRLDPSTPLPSVLLPALSHHLDLLASSSPLVLASALLAFLRLLPDHHRLLPLEVSFCVRVLRQHLRLCLPIGRDLVRLLHDVAFIPELNLLWKDLLLDPAVFGVPDFPGLHAIYALRTPSHFHLLRVSPEMETWTRFLLTEVKWGSERRHLEWFARRFLCRPEQEDAVVDLIRFVCCAHHPPNEVLRSGVVPRWAFVGWLLSYCRRSYLVANAKLALFYDWMFFDEASGNIMDVEPAMLLMANSVPKHAGFACALVEFLLILVDNYDVERKDAISRGVRAAFGACVRKGVVQSLEPLVSCEMIPAALRNRLRVLVPGLDAGVVQPEVPKGSSSDVPTNVESDKELETIKEASMLSRSCTLVGESSAFIQTGGIAEKTAQT